MGVVGVGLAGGLASGNEVDHSSLVFQMATSECEGGTGVEVENEGREIGCIFSVVSNCDACGWGAAEAAVHVGEVDRFAETDGVVVGAISKPPHKQSQLQCLRQSDHLPQSSSSALTSIRSSVPHGRLSSNIPEAAASFAN